jgi:hypothetical protein
LQTLNAAVIAHAIPGLRLRTVTVDVDGVVVCTGLQVERAFRGFNPHHRKVPSYYPILAHLAETTHILRVKNRAGNVHDGKASLPFLRDLWTQLTTSPAAAATVRFRMARSLYCCRAVPQEPASRNLEQRLATPACRRLTLLLLPVLRCDDSPVGCAICDRRSRFRSQDDREP